MDKNIAMAIIVSVLLSSMLTYGMLMYLPPRGEQGPQGESWRYDGEWVYVSSLECAGLNMRSHRQTVVEFSSPTWRMLWNYFSEDPNSHFTITIYKGEYGYEEIVGLANRSLYYGHFANVEVDAVEYRTFFRGRQCTDTYLSISGSGKYTVVVTGGPNNVYFSIYFDEFVEKTM